MKIKLLVILILLAGKQLVAQDKTILLQSFIKKDTVQLRWAPSSADGLIEGLKKGYEVKRINKSTGEESRITIPSFNDRKLALYQSSDSLVLFMTSFIDQLQSAGSQSKEAEAAFFMLSLSASTDRRIAEICGVYVEEIGLTKGEYTYEINFAGSSGYADSNTINTTILSKNPSCSELMGSSRVDLKEVYLNWEAKELNRDYGGYWIYKSLDGKSFEKLNTTPLYYFTSQFEPNKSTIDFIDTAVVEGMTYYYNIIPINYFADLGKASNTVKVYVQKRLTGICVIDTVRSTKFDRLIQVEYRALNHEGEISEYLLYRSDKVDSGYVLVDKKALNSKTVEFVYKANLLSGDRHYFKAAAVSPDLDTAWSFSYYHFSLDQEPPAMPTDLKGTISDSGVVYLTWTPPSDQDLRGYRVMRSNSLKEEFIEVTHFLSTATYFRDTLPLNNLTSEIYYRMRAVDLNYNNSPLTEPILILKPDTIAPVPSLIHDYKVESDGIFIAWANSQSEDLSTQFIIRSTPNQRDTILIFKNEASEFRDSSCVLGTRYSYQIVTVDKSGNMSYSDPISITFETGLRPGPSNLAGKVDRSAKNITLTWQIPQEQEIYSIQIYRAKNDGKLRLYKTFRESITSFEDKDLNPNNTYYYKIKIIYQSGHSSKMSEAVELVY